jgi:hypothetical protein
MKVTRKLQRAILSVLDDAANEVAERYIPRLSERPPDDWCSEETRAFDIAHEVADVAERRVKELFGPAPSLKKPKPARRHKASKGTSDIEGWMNVILTPERRHRGKSGADSGH